MPIRPRQPLEGPLREPLALARRLEGRPGLVVLDGDGSGVRGRFSYVASDPVEIFESRDDVADLLAAIDGATTETPDPLPRFIGFVAYDAARDAIDGSRHTPPSIPRAWFGRYDALAVFDAELGTAELVGDDESALARMATRLEASESPATFTVGPLVIDDAAAHTHAIETALAAILRGDVYQVNLARRFRASFEGSALGLYAAMRTASPVPFGGFLDTPGVSVLGRSMERFLAYDAGTRRLETRPIKGTIPESADRLEDAARLRADPKEHAEHVMVVDLLRNDLGRVAAIGSVQVDEALVVEPFARLSHLVSTVSCTLAPGHGLGSVLRETFPPGSVTGTPKRAAMRLIEALEAHARGVYCGAYGYVARDGSFSFAVAIRTATITESVLDYWAGGGIVHGSVPAREVAETELKARVLFDALAERHPSSDLPT